MQCQFAGHRRFPQHPPAKMESGTKWGRLRIAGLPAGALLSDDNPEEQAGWLAPPGLGSVIVVLATDAPLLPGWCKALARKPEVRREAGSLTRHFDEPLVAAAVLT